MNVKTLIVIAGLIGISGLSIYYTSANEREKETMIVSAVKTFLSRLHFEPAEINDEYSEVVFDEYIDRIDAGRRIFTEQDIQELAFYKDAIDDEYRASTMKFFEFSIGKLETSLIRSKGIFEKIIQEDIDFSINESLEIDVQKRPFAKDEKELESFWRKYIKYDVLNRVDNMTERQANKKEMLEDLESFYQKKNEEGEEVLDEEKIKEDREYIALPQDSLIARAHKKTKESFENWFERMEDMRRVDWLSQYMNALTNVFDPHTGYFKPKDKEDFDMRMSNRLEGIGARLSADGEYVKVADIVPGGPAWEGKDLQEDDLILKVAQEGEDAKDIMGMHLDDVVSLIRGPKGSVVTLTVKHVDGEIEEVNITRDVIVFEENYAKSAVLIDSTSNQSFGYINLPSFYADFDDPDARSSAGDMKAELEKINAEGLDGVIVDLRNNGGGSLRDVIDIAGLFIEEGPVVQVKSRNKKPYVLEDEDKEVVFDGAVVVLVNHFSASASEILAAALQDYERAVIVGASTTFGKGTVQRFYDLDRAVSGASNLKPLGSIKLTTQKYYRVDGGSVQLRGVTPDIILPDRYNYVDVGEKDYPHAMEWTKIESTEYGQNVNKVNQLTSLSEWSELRTSQHPTFQLVEESALLLKELKADTEIPLTFEGYETYKMKRDQLNERFDALDNEVKGLGASLLAADIEYVQADSSRLERYNDFLDAVDDDIYIEEAVAILKDMRKSQ